MVTLLKITIYKEFNITHTEVISFNDDEMLYLYSTHWYLTDDQYSILEETSIYNDLENGCGVVYELETCYMNTAMTKQELLSYRKEA